MDPNIMKTVHHITPKHGDTFSFNCPVCGCSHMQQHSQHKYYWLCKNGHTTYVSVYQSAAQTLNISLMPVPDEYS